MAPVLRLLFWLAASCSAVRAARRTRSGIEVPGPDEDPFYAAPPGIESLAPGTIVRSRPAPAPLSLDNKSALKPKAVWQLLYRTQNSVGKPEVTVATVIIPHNAKLGNVFSYGYFSDAAYNACNPSISMLVGTRDDNYITQYQNIITIAALNEGWVVVVADDGGPQASFSAGPHAGYATLDSLRAVIASGNITGVSSDPIITLFGYSGGSFSMSFASELHPHYAPELKIAGAAVGGISPNVTYLVEEDNGKPWAMFGPPVLLGISHDYPDFAQWLSENLIPEHEAEFRQAEKQCVSANHMFENKPTEYFFKKGVAGFKEPLPFNVTESAGSMGTRGPPKIPWYMYGSVGDDSAPVDLADKLYVSHCKQGANIYYERNPIPMSHKTECLYATPGAFVWLQDRHAGKPIVPGCSTAALTTESVRGVVEGVFFKAVRDNLAAWASQDEIGPKVGVNQTVVNPLIAPWTNASIAELPKPPNPLPSEPVPAPGAPVVTPEVPLIPVPSPTPQTAASASASGETVPPIAATPVAEPATPVSEPAAVTPSAPVAETPTVPASVSEAVTTSDPANTAAPAAPTPGTPAAPAAPTPEAPAATVPKAKGKGGRPKAPKAPKTAKGPKMPKMPRGKGAKGKGSGGVSGVSGLVLMAEEEEGERLVERGWRG
ncbi:LIP-domain-containing protein [Trichodelitschia bisporula]|uniref:LIP-domain-containing protein n=1 Tax=Trichodelitschia bisporula TaxID=703511 RepID=A0A6G1HQ34_9PEZI|nr:LIP-domain-containing protein [Trichodelitschia bisporula]